MKNIKVKLGIIISRLLFTTLANANRDAVSEITYKGNIHNPYNLRITTVNTACDNEEKYYEGNIFSVLNFGSDNGLNCSKVGFDNATCSITLPNNGPSSTYNQNFYLYRTYKSLAYKLGLPSKISNNITGNYRQDFKLKMLLSTDDNGGDMNQMTYFDFSDIRNPFSLTISYSDQNECKSKCLKEDTFDKDGKKDGEIEKCDPITIIDVDGGEPIINISDNKKPAKFGDVKIEGCNEVAGEYYCFATGAIDFKFSLSELGFDGSNAQGLNSVKVGLNNYANNTQISENTWKNFSDFIQTNTYTNKISISDTKFREKGNYTLEISGKGGNGAYIYQITPIYKKIHILPNNDFKITSTSVSSTNLYANNSDNYIVTANITDSFGNTLDTNYSVNEANIIGEGFDINKVDSGFQGEGLKISNSKFENNKFTFTLKSLVPGFKNVNFKISIPEHEMNSSLSAKTAKKDLNFIENISFLKPFTTSDFSIENASKRLEIGPSLNMVLAINKKTYLDIYNILDFSSNIKLGDNDNHEFNKYPVSIQNNNLKYSFTIDAKTNAGINIAPSIILDKNPIISYTLDGKEIKYYINKSTNPTDNTALSLVGVKGISGIKVVGTSQTTGKASTTNNIVNFTDLSKSTMRASVKKNVSIITKGLTVGKVVNGVLYFNGDKKISEIDNNDLLKTETLVIKNGNLIIDSNNLGINKEKFGIIVTRDDNSKTNLGNIYITPLVTYIKASIYADGGMISANNSGIPYTSDTDARTNILSNQLVIKGSTLTRNTIGGAVDAGGQYILPGGEKTSDFNKAMMYDMNYLRRSNLNQDSTKNGGNSNNVVIIYNSSIQTNPPKGFSSN